MDYSISCRQPLNHYLEIKLELSNSKAKSIDLILPSWRPGRYQLANYGKNIRNFQATGLRNKILSWEKLDSQRWRVTCQGHSKIRVSYEYYANQLDAGSSLVDDQQWYLNPINMLMYTEDKLNESCKLTLNVPKKYTIASGLTLNRYRKLEAKDYYQMVDAPIIASPHLKHWKFETSGIVFHLWFMGKHKLNKSQTIGHFKAFAEEQIATMGSFPESGYHFLFQLPAKSIYHGVEHANSTVIALGPGLKIHLDRYEDLLGVSSHELFHAWNILKIRPKSLLPYNFSKPNYFTEGYVAEGITTYYGDLFLVRSGVFDQSQYFKELNRLFKRHFENFGRHHTDLAQSSWDLWLDGYGGGAPDRKVSIYTKGALVALLLDLKLREETDNQSSLDDLMRYLWEHFGKSSKGYQTTDLIRFCNKVTNENFEEFFQRFVYSTEPLEGPIKEALQKVGCKLRRLPSQQLLKKWFGIRTSHATGEVTVVQIDPKAPAQKQLSIQDQIVRINGKKPPKNLNKCVGKSRTLKLEVRRNGRKITLKIPRGKRQYFHQYRIEKNAKATPAMQTNFEQWLKVKF